MKRVQGLLLIVCCAAAQAESPTYFVSTTGNDAWSGTLPAPNAEGTDGPVATPHRAQALLKTHAGEAGLPEGGSIYLRGGTYYLDEPIVISAQESGSPASPMLWQAYQFEPVRLLAGQPLQSENAGPAIQEITLETLPERPVQLLYGGKRLPPARWPNAAPPPEHLPFAPESYAYVLPGATTQQIRFTAAPESPGALTGVQVRLWLAGNRQEPPITVATWDPATRNFGLTQPVAQAPAAGSRFYLEGAPELLDAPGEWHLDPAAKRLRWFPPGEEAEELVLAASPSFFVISGARHVAILGLELVGAVGDAVVLDEASDVLVARNTILYSGGNAVVVRGGARNRAAGNDIAHCGAGGIVLNGGDRDTLEPAHHVAVNNHVREVGEVWKTFQAGISLSGVGNAAWNNLLHDLPHMAIRFEGNNHLIERNHIYTVCRETSNAGALYTYGGWAQRGTVIQNNRIHDVYGLGVRPAGTGDEQFTYISPWQAWGVYLDRAASGTHITSNQLLRIPLAGVMIAGGRDNVIENNVIVDSVPALHIDARWESYRWKELEQALAALRDNEAYKDHYPQWQSLPEDRQMRQPEGNRFRYNVVDYRRDDYRGLSTTEAVPETAVVYNLDRFASLPEDFAGNLIHHHGQPVRVLWNSTADGMRVLSWEDWQAAGYDADSVVDAPVFLAPEEDNYLVAQTSPAYKLGFKTVYMAGCGLYQDEFRASWPPPPPPPARDYAPQTVVVP